MKMFRADIATRPIRLLSKSDAAEYCCRSVRRFSVECPVSPVLMSNGDQLYDIRDLDAWIDGLKDGAGQGSASMALERLR